MGLYYTLRQFVPAVSIILIYIGNNHKALDFKQYEYTFLLFDCYLYFYLITLKIGVLHWGFYQLIAFKILSYKYETIHALCLSLLGVIGFAWIYELPWFHPFTMFINSNPFLLHEGFFSILFFIYYFKKDYKININTLFILFFFITYEYVILQTVINMNYGIRLIAVVRKIFLRTGAGITLILLSLDSIKQKPRHV
jgi:hypothetical protein